MTREEGLLEIDSAEWVKDEWGCLNLHVHAEDGSIVHVWLQLRPHYCDRGHIDMKIDGTLEIDSADSFPRFFFSAKEAKEHAKLFLKWRLWKFRVHPHELE